MKHRPAVIWTCSPAFAVGVGLFAAHGCTTPYLQGADDGCAEYAAGTCQALARCSDALIAPYGDVAHCQLQLARACLDNLQAPDVIGTGAGAAACGDLMTSVACDDIYNRELPLGCAAPAGRRGDGVKCSVSAQCASTRCAKDTGAATGTCQEPATVGEGCVVFDDCLPGQICGAPKVCVQLGAAGAACDDAHPCRSPLACGRGRCAPPLMAAAVDATQACTQFANAICSGLARCSTRLVESVYGDAVSCAQRTAQTCLDGLALADAHGSALGIMSCATALAAASCSALLENAMPVECRQAPGARGDGQACASDAQCQSTRCARNDGAAACGTCAELAVAEQPCAANSDCVIGLVCTGDHVCRAPSTVEVQCDATHPCAMPLVCASGACAGPLDAGATCDPTQDHCNVYAGLLCDPTALACKPWLSADAGQACGYTTTGYALCKASGACATSAAGSGSCLAAISDGASCTADGPAHCLPPARCITGACRLSPSEVCP